MRKHSLVFLLPLLLSASHLQSQPLLFQLNAGNGTMYLLGGSELPADRSWQSDTVIRAFSASEEFWTEIPVADPQRGIPSIREEVVPGSGSELHPVVIEEGYGNTQLRDFFDTSMGQRAVIESQRLNLQGVDYSAMQPWLAWFTFWYAFRDTLDVDLIDPAEVLYRNAVNQGKTVNSLFETRADWYRFLGSMNDVTQTQYFQHLYNLLDAMRSGNRATHYSWTDGLPDLLWVERIRNRTPLYHTYMYERRNTTLAEQLNGILQAGGVHFVYLDVDHLVGDDNVVVQLARMGVEVGVRQ